MARWRGSAVVFALAVVPAHIACQALLDLERDGVPDAVRDGGSDTDPAADVSPVTDAYSDAPAGFCDQDGGISLRFDFDDGGGATANDTFFRYAPRDAAVVIVGDAGLSPPNAVRAMTFESGNAVLELDLSPWGVSWSRVERVRLRLAAKPDSIALADDQWINLVELRAGTIKESARSDVSIFLGGPTEPEGAPVRGCITVDRGQGAGCSTKAVGLGLTRANEWIALTIELEQRPNDEVAVRFEAGEAGAKTSTAVFAGAADAGTDAIVHFGVGIVSASQAASVLIDDVTVDVCMRAPRP
jgi:hypothetical protein